MQSPVLRSEIELLDVGLIKPYEQNSKAHPDEQIDKLVKQILTVGWDQPIVLEPDYTIIKGHGRYLAAKRLGMEKVPVIITDLDKTRARAARIGDNKSAESAWIDDILKLELQDLSGLEDFDMDVLGFSDKELATYIGFDDYDIGTVEVGEDAEVPGQSMQKLSHVKMLQIFLNGETFPVLMERVARLQAIYKTETITDTIMEGIRAAYRLNFPD